MTREEFKERLSIEDSVDAYNDYIYCLEEQLKDLQEKYDAEIQAIEDNYQELTNLRELRKNINSLIHKLGTMQWVGADEGWDLAVDKVKEELIKIYMASSLI